MNTFFVVFFLAIMLIAQGFFVPTKFGNRVMRDFRSLNDGESVEKDQGKGRLYAVNVILSSELGNRLSQKILGRYTDAVPLALFRICGKSRNVVLREYAVQMAKGSRSYDLTLAEDGLVYPAPLDDVFIGPNGASLRPAGINMWDIVSSRRGITNVLEIPAGVKIPEGLVLLHEHGDHYSLQCTKPMKRKALEGLMNEFIADFPFYSKEEYFQKYPLAQR